MKIGIMGTHGTGKSTFARTMERVFRKFHEPVAVVTGVARSCPWPINQGVTEEAQRWIYHTHMLRELEAMNKAEFVVCDRTALDSLVYAEVGGLDAVVDDYLGAALAWMQTYDQLLWFRPSPGRLVPDGQRDCDPAFQERVDQVFAEWISAYFIPVLMVNNKMEGDNGQNG